MTALRALNDPATPDRRCIFAPCVATWAHSHGGFPGGYGHPDDPEGPPIAFTDPDPDPTAVRDYNGAAVGPATPEPVEGEPT
jgi:hypothetical protein